MEPATGPRPSIAMIPHIEKYLSFWVKSDLCRLEHDLQKSCRLFGYDHAAKQRHTDHERFNLTRSWSSKSLKKPRSFPLLFPESLGPAWLLDWPRPRQPQRIGRNVLCNHGPGPDIGTLADLDRRHQGAVRADERMRADLRAVFGKAIIIASNRARANIRFGADACVSDIAQMVDLRSGADVGGLHLDEIADVHIMRKIGAGT